MIFIVSTEPVAILKIVDTSPEIVWLSLFTDSVTAFTGLKSNGKQVIYQFIGVRFICGFFHSPVITLPYILAMDMISPSKRATVGMMTTPSFCMGCLYVPYLPFVIKIHGNKPHAHV